MTDLSNDMQMLACRVRKRLCKPVVLTGMMGSGKSHVGSILARLLEVEHQDSDGLLEKQEGRKVSDIFAQDGEAAFRTLERGVIEKLIRGGVSVISTGGGCLTVSEVARLIREEGVSVWLKAPVEVLYERVRHTKYRPLINCDDPKGRLAALLAEREPLYSQADVIIDDPLEGADVLALCVLKGLEGYLGDE